MQSQVTESLSDKEVRLGLYMQALKAGKNVESLEEQLEMYKSKYNKIGFELSETEFLFNDFIHHLETELQEEKEFISHVYEQYCTDASKSTKVEGVSKKCGRWN